MSEKTVFLTRCLLSGSIGESLYLLGVWFLGSVTVVQSVILGSSAFIVSLPLTFALDRRAQSFVGHLYRRLGRTNRRVDGRSTRLGLSSITTNEVGAKTGAEPSRTIPASELKMDYTITDSVDHPHGMAEPALGLLSRDMA